MDDLISRQAAIDAFDCTDELTVTGNENAQNVMNYINKVVGKIKALPSAQPKKGKWVRTTKHYKDSEQECSYYEIHCSECGAKRKIGWHDARFCPNCGARMEASHAGDL